MYYGLIIGGISYVFVKRDKRTGSGKGTNYAEISRRSVAQFSHVQMRLEESAQISML